jgi:hypothetical protein
MFVQKHLTSQMVFPGCAGGAGGGTYPACLALGPVAVCCNEATLTGPRNLIKQNWEMWDSGLRETVHVWEVLTSLQ